MLTGVVPRPDSPVAMPLGALDLFAQVLSEAEGGPQRLYSRMAEATCRLGSMRRAVFFAYDDERREVRAMGSHGIALELFDGASPAANSVEVARRALADDVVVEMTGDVERELPEEFHHLLMHGLVVCIPMAAGGRGLGVIMADRDADLGPLTDAQRHSLWSLGKVAALAAGARNAAREHERSRQLADRLDFARDLHEAVVQRLFGVSLALSGQGALSHADRERCAEEVVAALSELRAALQRPLARSSPPTTRTVQEEVRRLARAHDLDVGLAEGEDVIVASELQPVAQSVLREAVRNAAKHAEPTVVEVRLRVAEGAFVLEVANDGVTARRGRRAGMGLRLAALEALEHGGIVEFGPEGADRWRVRLTVPLSDEGDKA